MSEFLGGPFFVFKWRAHEQPDKGVEHPARWFTIQYMVREELLVKNMGYDVAEVKWLVKILVFFGTCVDVMITPFWHRTNDNHHIGCQRLHSNASVKSWSPGMGSCSKYSPHWNNNYRGIFLFALGELSIPTAINLIAAPHQLACFNQLGYWHRLERIHQFV